MVMFQVTSLIAYYRIVGGVATRGGRVRASSLATACLSILLLGSARYSASNATVRNRFRVPPDVTNT